MFSNALETDIQEGEKILKRLMMYASSGIYLESVKGVEITTKYI